MDIDDEFTKALKTMNPNFWSTHATELVDAVGITPAFSKMLTEEMMVPTKDFDVAFYNTFRGEALNSGYGWVERMLAIPGSKRYNPKATAQDAFGYNESEGFQAIYETHYQGWVPLSVPSNLALGELVSNPAKIGDFASYILKNGKTSVQMDINAMIGKKLVSTIEHTEPIDTADFDVVRKKIRDLASDFRTNQGLYVNADVDPDKFLTASKKVAVIMEEKTYNDMVSDLAVLPSPDKIVSNAEIITIPEMPTAITTAEITTGVTANGWTIAGAPEFLDGGKPFAIVTSMDRIAYRPYQGESKINSNTNGAGDYTNFHILYKGCIGVRPWENCVAITTAPASP